MTVIHGSDKSYLPSYKERARENVYQDLNIKTDSYAL